MDSPYAIEILPLKVTIPCHPSQTILSAMERAKVAMALVGCRRGGCGICKVQILEGEVEAGPMNCVHIGQAEEEKGILLACRIKPKSAVRLKIVEAG